MAIGFTEDGEKTWLQTLHRHLKNARDAAINVMAHNLDDQGSIFEVQDTIEKAVEQTKAICIQKKVPI